MPATQAPLALRAGAWRGGLPGVYRDELILAPLARLPSGVAGFAGFGRPADPAAAGQARALYGEGDFARLVRAAEGSLLAEAVAGFFRNGGTCCHVACADPGLAPEDGLKRAVESLAAVDDIDLIAVPDAMTLRSSDVKHRDGAYLHLRLDTIAAFQRWLLGHCAALGDRFAILDTLPAHAGGPAESLPGRATLPPAAAMSGALYGPWLRLPAGGLQPPSGHVAGIYARSDARTGVFKAPANEVIEGVIDLQDVAELPEGVNALRAFPGRGIRVWGARTLSSEVAWRQVNVRRLFILIRRWIDRRMPWATFEPAGPALWQRIERELGAFLDTLWQRGALQGDAPAQAYYVKCNAETNGSHGGPPDRVVTEIGLAPVLPAEYVVVRIVHRMGGAEDDPPPSR